MGQDLIEIETFYIIDAPGWDRRFVERRMTPERFRQLKADTPGTRVFKVQVAIPARDVGETFDELAHVQAVKELT